MPNRNTENHFGMVPSMSMPRSAFNMAHSLLTTVNTGDIVPIYWKECLPGDSCKINVSELIRMTTPINPVMDNAYADTYFFKVPRRLVDEHWPEFMGENKDDAWTQKKEFVVPKTTAPSGGWQKGSIASYFGMPIGVDGIEMDSAYLRAYALICNEWFRNQSLTEPIEISLGQETTQGSNGTDYVVDVQKGGMPFKAVKFADYFTRALPEPQKGPDVFVPLGSSAPVVGNGMTIGVTNGTLNAGISASGDSAYMKTKLSSYGKEAGFTDTSNTSLGTNKGVGLTTDPDYSGMVADLSQAEGATINQLRQAFAVQRLYELDANGTRYTEVILNHFKVRVPDARLQRPEYVGGKRVNINMTDVINHTANDTAPLGHEAGESKTIDNSQFIETAFVEHSLLIGLMVIRTDHTYQQGIERAFSRKTRLDFYFPELANLGEQGILNKEIYAQGTFADDEIFGYQEAWAEYRYEQNLVTGEMNSNYSTPLDSWHYADDYSQLPTLSDEWIRETRVNVDRTLAIQNQDQFKVNIYFDSTWFRPLPIYSIPSLTGWH